MNQKTINRFWSYVEKTDGCWLWTGGCFQNVCKSKYGQFSVNRHPVKAHRFSWELHNGSIPEGMHVLHRCDVGNCVNPDHLWLGTHQDNMDDMMRKGRRAPSLKIEPGEKCPAHKLTDQAVLEIRRSGMSARKLASAFGVGRSTIRHILSRRTWSHLPV